MRPLCEDEPADKRPRAAKLHRDHSFWGRIRQLTDMRCNKTVTAGVIHSRVYSCFHCWNEKPEMTWRVRCAPKVTLHSVSFLTPKSIKSGAHTYYQWLCHPHDSSSCWTVAVGGKPWERSQAYHRSRHRSWSSRNVKRSPTKAIA